MLARAPTTNRLLEGLPRADLRRILAACDPVELAFADVLYTPREPLTHVYFPILGSISLIMPVDGSNALEVAIVGNEGMVGVALALGVDVSPLRALVQGAGSALRMAARPFCREIARSAALKRTIDRYVFVHLGQLAQTAACMRFHVVEARLARWLLVTQDRAHADTFHVTQEFLAFMLGVRRVGVTEAAGALQKRGLIQYRRGRMTIVDRRALKGAACGCYEADRATYERILGG